MPGGRTVRNSRRNHNGGFRDSPNVSSTAFLSVALSACADASAVTALHNAGRTFERKPAREGLIRLGDQTGRVELIEPKASRAVRVSGKRQSSEADPSRRNPDVAHRAHGGAPGGDRVERVTALDAARPRFARPRPRRPDSFGASHARPQLPRDYGQVPARPA
jgi:hypothetical protein